jgi:hypothetical protein
MTGAPHEGQRLGLPPLVRAAIRPAFRSGPAVRCRSSIGVDDVSERGAQRVGRALQLVTELEWAAVDAVPEPGGELVALAALERHQADGERLGDVSFALLPGLRGDGLDVGELRSPEARRVPDWNSALATPWNGLGDLQHFGGGGLQELGEVVLEELGELLLAHELAVEGEPLLPRVGGAQGELEAVVSPAGRVGGVGVEDGGDGEAFGVGVDLAVPRRRACRSRRGRRSASRTVVVPVLRVGWCRCTRSPVRSTCAMPDGVAKA